MSRIPYIFKLLSNVGKLRNSSKMSKNKLCAEDDRRQNTKLRIDMVDSALDYGTDRELTQLTTQQLISSTRKN